MQSAREQSVCERRILEAFEIRGSSNSIKLKRNCGIMGIFNEFAESCRRKERMQGRLARTGCELGMDCPIKAEFEQAVDLGEQVVGVIRNLVKYMTIHEQCSSSRDCPILQCSNSMIDEVIQEINDEWGLML